MSVRIFICLFCAAFLLRFLLLVFIWDQPLNIVDEQHYQALARTLLNHGSYLGESGQPTAMRPPLYPAFLALLYAVWGSVDPNIVRVAQTILSLLAALLLWSMGRRIWGQNEAVIAAAVFFIYPSLMFFNGLVLAESLFVLLLLVFLFLLERYLRTGTIPSAALAGIVLGVVSLTRSITYPLALPLALLLFWQRRKAPWRSTFCALIFLFCFALTLAPWAIRNHQVFGTFAPVGTMGGLNLAMGNYEFTPLHKSWAAVEVAGAQSWGHVYHNEIAGLNEGQKQSKAMALAKQYIVNHPGQTMLRSLIKLANFWGLERTIIAGLQQGIFPGLSNRYLTIVLIPLILIPYILVALGGFFGLLWRLLYDRQGFDLFFALLLVGMTGMHALIFGHPRYHLPLIPVLCGYAVWAVVHFKQLWAVHRKRVQVVALPVLIFFGLVWSYDVLVGSQDKLAALLRHLL